METRTPLSFSDIDDLCWTKDVALVDSGVDSLRWAFQTLVTVHHEAGLLSSLLHSASFLSLMRPPAAVSFTNLISVELCRSGHDALPSVMVLEVFLPTLCGGKTAIRTVTPGGPCDYSILF